MRVCPEPVEGTRRFRTMGKAGMKRKEVFTTGEVASICHVAPRTVSKWFDAGQLRGYRIPGSRDRRIPLQQLVQFMRANGLPMEELEGHAIRVLIVDPDVSASRAVATSLSQSSRYEVATAANEFEAGMMAEKFQPHVIFLDVAGETKPDGSQGTSDPGVAAAEILRNIRANEALTATKIVAVSHSLTRGQAANLHKDGYDLVLSKPYQAEEVVRLIEQATDLAF